MRRRSTRWPWSRRLSRTLVVLGLFAAPASPPIARAEGAAAASPPACSGDLRLVASVVVDARPDLSLAMVRRGAGEGAAMVNVGGSLEGYTLAALERDRAYLRSREGAICTLSVFGAHAARAPAEPPPHAPAEDPPEPPKGKAVFTRDELARGVSELGGDRYRIERALLLRALGNPGGAAGGAYFRAIERDGRTVGMELRGVRAPSALSAMGLRTGDVVHRVNGISLDDALELLSALRSAREAELVSLDITRAGAPRVFQYQIE